MVIIRPHGRVPAPGGMMRQPGGAAGGLRNNTRSALRVRYPPFHVGARNRCLDASGICKAGRGATNPASICWNRGYIAGEGEWEQVKFGSGPPPIAAVRMPPANRRYGRVEDGRGSLGHAATLRFPSPLIEPDVRISCIRLSDWLHREAHGARDQGRRSSSLHALLGHT